MRITSFALNLRSESLSPPSDDTSDEVSGPKTKWLIPLEGPPAYISLLGTEPYKPASVLSRPSGLPSNPRLSLPPSSPSGSKKAEFMLTPDTLRYLAATVAEFSSQISEIQLAYRAALTRTVLQRSELARLSGKCREIETIVGDLKGPKRVARFENIQNEQQILLGRLDRMLQGLMEKASPELSEHETKWFEELKRMKDEITGVGKYDEVSLVSRIRLVCICSFPNIESI